MADAGRKSLLTRLARCSAGRLLHDHVRPEAAALILAALCMAAFAASTAGQAWIMEPMLDRVFLERDHALLLLVPFAVLVLALVKAAAGCGQSVIMARVGQRIVAGVQQRLFDHLLRADLGYVIERGPGSLISGLTYDAQLLRGAAAGAVTGIARDLLTILCLLAVMFYQDWRLACIGLVGLPLAWLPLARLGRRMREVSAHGQVEMARLTGRLEETFRGVRQIKADNRETAESRRIGALLGQLWRRVDQASRLEAVGSPMMEMAGGMALAAVVFYGGTQVLAGSTTPGTFLSFVAAVLLAYRPLKSLAKLHTQLQAGLAAADRVYAVLDQAPAIRDRPDACPLQVGAGEIRFDRVRFGYRPGRPALCGLDLVILAGRRVALVGPSGAGKSTMLNLILRFYEVDDGAVLIDGQDVRRVTLASLRGAIALVGQEVHLFDDTVRANIAYGRPDAPFEAIAAAARAAAAHDFIRSLPEGYDTRVGPAGATLSGGERQRIGIARAMLKDAPILLLDEATSALDGPAEQAVQSALRRLMRGRTTVVIAHRLSTVIGADLIAVIEDGRIVETGTHRVLLARGGSYARLYEHQFADQPSLAWPLEVTTAASSGGGL